MQKPPPGGSNGLDGLTGTPQRIESPAVAQPTNNMDDLMGIFGSGPEPANTSAAADDLMNGFGGLNMDAAPAVPAQSQKQTNDDILGLF